MIWNGRSLKARRCRFPTICWRYSGNADLTRAAYVGVRMRQLSAVKRDPVGSQPADASATSRAACNVVPLVSGRRYVHSTLAKASTASIGPIAQLP
jgi:hypothetical protein